MFFWCIMFFMHIVYYFCFVFGKFNFIFCVVDVFSTRLFHSKKGVAYGVGTD